MNFSIRVSSGHDVCYISQYFIKMVFGYESLHGPRSCTFRLIIIDFAWALIHSILKEFNNETVIEYAHRVFANNAKLAYATSFSAALQIYI